MAAASEPQRLRGHVEHLAGTIGERHVFRPQALDRAADYIRGQLQGTGYAVTEQAYRLRGVDCANLEATLDGQDRGAGTLVIGAHYDSVMGAPGANDNASGVASLLEMARLLSAARPRASLRFVAFVNEEPPFFATGDQGSMRYAAAARERGDRIRMMICLETIGYYSDCPGSQLYPPLFRSFYPDRGDFIALVANYRSWLAMRRLARAFRRVSDFPLEHVAAPALVPGVSWSDHRSFWRHGYPAVMVTDTAPYRYPWYHSPGDTPERVSYERLAQVTDGLVGAAARLAG